MDMMKERPPYVTFEIRSVKDEAASVKAGHPVFIDVDYALITPIGGKDQVTRSVEDWFESLEAQLRDERIPQLWVDHFRSMYQAWKKGQELPVNGLSVKMWPVATPAEVSSLLAANVLTVEDLAQANEATLARIGMGARVLKNKAEAYLQASEKGKVAEKISKLEQDIENYKLRIAALEKENAGLISKIVEEKAA